MQPVARGKNMNADIFLFDSIKAAQEVAFSLRGNWDGCNCIEFNKQSDNAALKLAANICNAEYCQAGEACNIHLESSFFKGERNQDNTEDDGYKQIMLKVIKDLIEEKSKSKLVIGEQRPEVLGSNNAKICVLQNDNKNYCHRTVSAENEIEKDKFVSRLEEAGFLVIQKLDG